MTLKKNAKKTTGDKQSQRDLQQIKKALQNIRHSTKPLHQVIIPLCDLLLKNMNEQNEELVLSVVNTYLDIVTELSELSRKWTISIHWAFTVCNPKIYDTSNPAYSPVYIKHQCSLPPDCFGEMTAQEVVDDKLISHGDKLVGDDRFTDIANFGTAFNHAGEVIKKDEQGHPVRDGFFGWVATNVDNLITRVTQNSNRDRHTEAFLIAHTRDFDNDERENTPKHKEAHIHIVLDLPRMMSRYQVMEAMSFNFEDFVQAFEWIGKHSIDMDDLIARMNSFLGSLKGSIKNFNIPEHYIASLQYLVHQSKKAIKDQKAVYSTSEVISWMPDEPAQTYETIAGVYDSQAVAEGIHAELIRILHSPYNTAHHTEKYVGKLFSMDLLETMHGLGKKKPGSSTFTKASRLAITNQVMTSLRKGEIGFNDWKILLHASYEDADADYLLGNIDFMKQIESIIQNEEQAIIEDPSFKRSMLTVAIFAKTGGIGKTRLANTMARLLDKGRKPFQVVAKSDGITFDPYQGYAAQSSVVLDEISPSTWTYEAFKDAFDGKKLPQVSSRYHNTVPFNVRYSFLTNVFPDGISGFVNDLLHYSKGVSKLGYLRKEYPDWKLILNDPKAARIYIAQLSQVLRRLPYVISLKATPNGLGTTIKVSRINYKPGFGLVNHYDYVSTQKSQHTFKTVINDDLSDEGMEKIAKKVIKMLRTLEDDAQNAFKSHPSKLLDELEGFIPDHCNFHVRYRSNGDPYLTEDKSQIDMMFENDDCVQNWVAPKTNLITRLSNTYMIMWDDNKTYTNVAPKMNQLEAFLAGYEVPIERDGYGKVKTMKLTTKGLDYYHEHSTDMWLKLNSTHFIDKKGELVEMQINQDIANFKVIEKGDDNNGK